MATQAKRIVSRQRETRRRFLFAGLGLLTFPALGWAMADTRQASSSSKIFYSPNDLPEPVRRTHGALYRAARSGNVARLREVMEENELKPMAHHGALDDPITYWKKISADGEGREILAILSEVLEMGVAQLEENGTTYFVWPHFPFVSLENLSPADEVSLFRLMPAKDALAMRKSGRYTYYRLGISADGIWHYFLKDEASGKPPP